MKLHYWNGRNFGDQLNGYIFPKLIPELLLDDRKAPLLCGIGSILHHQLVSSDIPVVVFGSGMRDPAPVSGSEGWDVRFVRGPLSANCLGQPTNYITDSAYLLPLLKEFQAAASQSKKLHQVSLMPYFSYDSKLPWQTLCSRAGINYISPSASPEKVIESILQSRHMIAGAMHGAIVADICRVPWVRLRMDQHPTESALTTEFKWADWMLSVGANTNAHVKLNWNDLENSGSRLSKFIFALEFLSKFRNRKHVHYQLSDDQIFSIVSGRLAEAVDSLRYDFFTTN